MGVAWGRVQGNLIYDITQNKYWPMSRVINDKHETSVNVSIQGGFQLLFGDLYGIEYTHTVCASPIYSITRYIVPFPPWTSSAV